MAVSIMSARGPASVLSLYLLACSLRVLVHGEALRQVPPAQAVFLRSKRANIFLVEEILQGNLERECYEELCNFEEARECFEDMEKTVAFWTVYYDGDQCVPNPCLHGGNCTDKVGGFQCSCDAPYFGPICELGGSWTSASQVTKPEIVACPTGGPAACHQLCRAAHHSFICSCLTGFTLQPDKRSCRPQVALPCGKLPDIFNSTESLCRHGNCPWQVSLFNRVGVEQCAGVVLGRRSVLTTASCLLSDSGSKPRANDFYVLAGAGNNNVLVRVQAVHIHNRFHPGRHDNDLAMLELLRPLPFSPALIHVCLPTKDFSENVLMRSGRTGVAERRGGARDQDLVYMTLDECRVQLNVSHPLSNKMFCMRKHSGPSGNRNEAQGIANGPSGNQSVEQRELNGPLGNQNEAQGIPNGPLGNHSVEQTELNGPLRNHHGIQGQNKPIGNQKRPKRSPNKPSGNQNGEQRQEESFRSPDGARGRPHGHTGNSSHSGARGTPNGAGSQQISGSASENQKPSGSDGGLRSAVGGPLPGSPVATVEKGTAFLTGLLMSPSAGCDGVVFAKLSRYLSWIRPTMEAIEDRMVPQVSQYPETR